MLQMSSSFRMADRLTDGQLETLLGEYRAARTPWPTIGRLLKSKYGVEASPVTLSGWADQLGIATEEGS